MYIETLVNRFYIKITGILILRFFDDIINLYIANALRGMSPQERYIFRQLLGSNMLLGRNIVFWPEVIEKDFFQDELTY